MGIINIEMDISALNELYRNAELELKKEIVDGLTKIGEKYMNLAKQTGTYKDRTGNLRNSNSYRVYQNGVAVAEYIGRPETGQMFEDLATGRGIELIVGNGREYASFVEGKGYNVVSEAFLWVEDEIIKMQAR
jgi:hypothetical protein